MMLKVSMATTYPVFSGARPCSARFNSGQLGAAAEVLELG
jgi:hypothetical protein